MGLASLSCNIRKGEIIGFHGVNGSGKSTLLKMISGIIPPSQGTIRVGGRVVALLELDAGLHRDLSGLDNIYIIGSLYGLSHAEIKSRLQSIVDFSGLGEWIELPTKYYSSGMIARLSFSLVMHIPADILILDEVFAVGDYEFQKKCIDALRSKDRNLTVIVTSHATEIFGTLGARVISLQKLTYHEYCQYEEFKTKLFEVTQGSKLHVVQAGAFDGVSNDFVRPLLSGANFKLLCLEPEPKNFAQLVGNYEGIVGVTCLPVALGNQDCTRELYVVRPGSGIPPWCAELASFNKETILSHEQYVSGLREQIIPITVPVHTLDTIVKTNNFPRVDLLAIDCEGVDYEIVLTALKQKNLPRALIYEHAHMSSEKQQVLARQLDRLDYTTWKTSTDTFAIRNAKIRREKEGGGSLKR
jgi:FkbM family methyltransferase